jgi:hypothetical protein
MATNAPSVESVTLQKLIDGIIASIRFNSGSAPSAAPNAFKNRNQETITVTDASEFVVTVKVNGGGTSAWAKVEPLGSIASSIEGAVDLTTLATKLV